MSSIEYRVYKRRVFQVFRVDPSNTVKSIAEALEERVDMLQKDDWIIDQIIETKSKFGDEQAFIIIAYYYFLEGTTSGEATL